MSIIPPSIIRVYAETLGITNLPEEALTTLSQDLEYRIREIIQDASKFMNHSRRQKLSVEDVNAAMKQRNLELLYGFEPTEPLAFRAVPNTGLFYVPTDELDVESVLQEPLPKAPQPMCLTSHWLAIEGVQPQIPQNPVIPERNAIGESVNPNAPKSEVSVIPGRRDFISEDAEIKPQVRHVLSKEHQLYYDTLISDLMEGSTPGSPDYSNAAISAISALKNDAGIQQILPYFVQFIAETVLKSLLTGLRLRMTMDMAGSLLNNEHLFVEPYLHQLMPPILTCVVGKRLGEEDFDHWSLRLQASELVALIVHNYGNTYSTLLPRITKTLAKALSYDPASHEIKPFSTHFGAIIALTLLGPHTIEAILFPMLDNYMQFVTRPENAAALGNQQEKEKVLSAIKNAVNQWRENQSKDDSSSNQYTALLNKYF